MDYNTVYRSENKREHMTVEYSVAWSVNLRQVVDSVTSTVESSVAQRVLLLVVKTDTSSAAVTAVQWDSLLAVKMEIFSVDEMVDSWESDVVAL